jgi:hypothetical protein
MNKTGFQVPCMIHIQKTRKQAERYARIVSELRREVWVPFLVPPDSRAAEHGNYGTCRDSEREVYRAMGCKFLDEEPRR